MTLGAAIAWDDTVLPFQLDRSDIRGRVARVDGLLGRILEQHDYPPAIEALVAEAVLLTALIGQTIKLRWRLSLQVRGKGPARLIATDYYAPGTDGEPARIRAYASFDRDRLDPMAEGFAQIGEGYLAIIIDQGADMTPYQGLTSLAGGSLSASAEHYFAQSEQLPTRFAASFGRSTLPGQGEHWRAGGIMLQHLPPSGAGVTPAAAGPEDWSRANILLDTVEDLELVGPSVAPTDLLRRLFHEEAPRVYAPRPLKFGCSCSEAKVRQSLSIYSARDIAHMTTPQGTVTADCQFCGAHYVLDPRSVGFEAVATDQAGGGPA